MFFYLFNLIWYFKIIFIKLIINLYFINNFFFIFLYSYIIKNFFFFLFLILLFIISTAFLTLLERKKMASFQHRRGPNNVGMMGTLQPFADAFKLLFKEIIIPKNSIFVIFSLAPLLASIFGFFNWALFSFHNLFSVVSDLNLGFLFFFSISSLHVYSIILAGWSSNSRYSFLGAVRSSAQLIAYDISFSLIMLNIALITKSLNLSEIVLYQKIAGNLGYFYYFLFILFLMCCIAETNRHPFDLPEAESELVSGYNVEYSSINFALFFSGEYTSILFMSSLMIILFWGGWLTSFFYLKILLMVFVFIILRAEIPRYRYDQLMDLGWRVILPFTLYLFFWNFCLFFIFNMFNTHFLIFFKIIIF